MSEEPSSWPGPGDEHFDPGRHYWDGNEWWTKDRKYWWDGSRWQPWDAPHVSGVDLPSAAAPLPGKPRPPGYRRDFWLGFSGVIVVNVVILIALSNIAAANSGQAGSVLNLMPWVLNIGALIVFGIVRPRVALGMLTAYGVALGLALLAGLFLLVLCFGGGAGVP